MGKYTVNLQKKVSRHWPVRIVWNASSTLEESKADVSKKDNPYFSKNTHQHRKQLDCFTSYKYGKMQR